MNKLNCTALLLITFFTFNIHSQTDEKKQNLLMDIKNGKLSYEKVPKKYKNDKEIVIAALEKDGSSLEFVDTLLFSDRDILLSALQNGYTTESVEYKDENGEVMYDEIQINKSLSYAPGSFKQGQRNSHCLS